MKIQSLESGASADETRLLLVNPNGNAAVTRLAEQSLRRIMGPRTTFTAIYPEASPLSIETPEDREKAEPLGIELLSRNLGYDAYVMACFDDIGVSAGRTLLRAPIVCAAEAAIGVARLYATRFTIITTVETMVPGIQRLLASLGVKDGCTVRALGIGVAEVVGRDDEIAGGIAAAIEKARAQDGAGAIIFGSGGLAGRAQALMQRNCIPVIDSIEAAIATAEIAARLNGLSKARADP